MKQTINKDQLGQVSGGIISADCKLTDKITGRKTNGFIPPKLTIGSCDPASITIGTAQSCDPASIT